MRAPGMVYVAAMARRMPNTHGPTKLSICVTALCDIREECSVPCELPYPWNGWSALTIGNNPGGEIPRHGDRILERAKVSKVRALDEGRGRP